MIDCPDTAALMDLEDSARWSGLELVRHVAGCDACRAELADLERMHEAVMRPEDVPHEELEATLALLDREGARAQPVAPAGAKPALPYPAAQALLFLLAFCTAVAIQLVGATAATGPASPVVMGLLGLIAAVASTILLRGRARGYT